MKPALYAFCPSGENKYAAADDIFENTAVQQVRLSAVFSFCLVTETGATFLPVQGYTLRLTVFAGGGRGIFGTDSLLLRLVRVCHLLLRVCSDSQF